MLVVSRKKNETILVGDVRIQIVQIKGHAVRIGIEAPPHIKVLRGELVGREPKKKEGAA